MVRNSDRQIRLAGVSQDVHPTYWNEWVAVRGSFRLPVNPTLGETVKPKGKKKSKRQKIPVALIVMLFNFVNTWHYHPDVRLVAACSSKVVKSWLFVTSAAGVSAAAGVNREWIQKGNLMLLSQIHICPNVQKFYSEQLIIIYCLILWCLFISSACHVGSGILDGPVLLSTCHFPSLRLKATFHFFNAFLSQLKPWLKPPKTSRKSLQLCNIEIQ